MPLAPPVIKIVLLVSFIILSSLGRRPTESRNGGHVQMRHRIESQGLLEQLSIELQELARVCRASIRDDKTEDRKSTRLNSSHQIISYAVFCLKKKKRKMNPTDVQQNQ